MKTTIQIPDSLLEEVRKLASQEQTTLRALVEEGLRWILKERKKARAFRLRKASFKGEGLQPHVAGVLLRSGRDAVEPDSVAALSEGEAVLIRYANPARLISKDGSSAENDSLESIVMLLVQIAEAEKGVRSGRHTSEEVYE